MWENQIRGALDMVRIGYSLSQPVINLTTASRPFSKVFCVTENSLEEEDWEGSDASASSV